MVQVSLFVPRATNDGRYLGPSLTPPAAQCHAVLALGLDFFKPPTEPNGFPAPEAQLPWYRAQARRQAAAHARLRCVRAHHAHVLQPLLFNSHTRATANWQRGLQKAVRTVLLIDDSSFFVTKSQ